MKTSAVTYGQNASGTGKAMVGKEGATNAMQTGKPVKQKKLPPASAESSFKGYTLEEMRMRKVVNELKIKITKEKLYSMVSPKAREESNAIKSCVRGFDNAMKYFDIAMMAYGVTKRVFSLFRRFGGKRR